MNDSQGHLFGDAFLIEIAQVIQKLFRGGDVVGRIGGDEFLVFIKDIPSVDLAEQKAGQILRAFAGLVKRNECSDRISCSIGIAVAPTDGETFQELYRKADQALYQAKKMGKNRALVYDGTSMDEAWTGIPKRMK